jgi:arylsulfatase A
MKFGLTACVLFVVLCGGGAHADESPNVVIIFADDLGYGDVGCYGAQGYATPHIDRLAREGAKLTRFYAASSVCSSSRAALMTGCYPMRVGVQGVISANVKIGIAAEEITIAEMLKAKGYRTGAFGKWHLGNQEMFLPSRHGFDEFLGTRGSNDMGKGRPSLEDRRKGLAGVEFIEGDAVIEINPDQSQLTKRYTDRAVAFIEDAAGAGEPFFLYVPHNMPHTPLFASEKFAGKTSRGLFGDVIEEIDWSVGEIVKSLETNGVADNTLVIFTSDNGPWLIFGDQGGSAGALSGGKKQLLEGGVRVPCVMWWPSKIKAGRVVDKLATTMDIWPTVARLVGADMPGHKIDGVNIWEMVSGAPPTSPRKLFGYYWMDELHAVTDGRWKLRFAHTDTQAPDPKQVGHGGERGAVMSVKRGAALFDLHADEAEKTDVSASHPKVIQRLNKAADGLRGELGDKLKKLKGSGVRKVGVAE